jgi:hypothetical protein
MNWILTEGDFACIGKVALESTQMEMTLDFLIPAILRLDITVYQTLTYGKPVAQKIQMFRQAGLTRLRGKKKVDEFTAMTAEMAEVNELRNIAVHGRWAPKLAHTMTLGELFDFDNKDHLIATTPRDKKRKLTKKRLNELPIEMAALNQQLFGFWRKAWVMPSTKRLEAHTKKKLKQWEDAAAERAKQADETGGSQ